MLMSEKTKGLQRPKNRFSLSTRFPRLPVLPVEHKRKCLFSVEDNSHRIVWLAHLSKESMLNYNFASSSRQYIIDFFSGCIEDQTQSATNTKPRAFAPLLVTVNDSLLFSR